MEKMVLTICFLIISLFFLCDFLFPEKIAGLSLVVFDRLNVFRDLREDFNELTDKIDYIDQMNVGKLDNLENTFFSPIYKREYEELIAVYKLNNVSELTDQFSLCVLLSSIGDVNSEILRIKSEKTIASRGFVVSPQFSSVIGKIIKSYGKTADIAPIWSSLFTSQVYVQSENEIEGINNDLALIEKGQLINFNPALPYENGDEIRIAGTEFGGYNLERYNLNRIGTVSAIKNTEIVEKYEIDYDFSREAILNNRYFYIIEDLK
ncbi:MAG TPA: hypothetical protein PK466_01205 [Thermotogota bacterium]|nr:hypothetical protein [Thermotogota bacterium]HPJ87643.1 hypothetical protein [Thermotogota bacterium]HPR94919.1 hypothetical protein [Thermotogota bacterium]